MQKETLLVIDDDPHLLTLLTELIPQYEFLGASTARSGLDVLSRSHHVDLILLDYRLPDKDGLDVLREIHEMKLGIGVIMMSSYASKDVIIESLDAHVSAFIEKPLDYEKLRQKIERVLNETHMYRDNDRFLKNKIFSTKQFMADNLDKQISVKELSEKSAYNPKYFSRAFKECTGETFTHFKLRAKVSKAKTLLATTHASVQQVSETLGYSSPYSFMKMFKKETGMTPTEYRKKEAERELVPV